MNSVDTTQKINQDLLDGISVFLRKLSSEHFFGVVEISFQDGNPIIVRKEETFKPVIFLTIK